MLFAGDCDRGVWEKPGIFLSEMTGVDLAKINNSYLKSYEGLLWNAARGHGVWRHILHKNNRYKNKYSYSLQYCPQCLANDEFPYFRKLWRLSLVVTCDQHNVLLRDRCPHCGSIVLIHKITTHYSWSNTHLNLSMCWQCKQSLTHATHHNSELSEILIWFQNWVTSTIKQGWCKINGEVVYSTLMFDGIHILLSFLDSHYYKQLLPFDKRRGACRYGGVEKQSHEVRRILIEELSVWIRYWPTASIKSLKQRNISWGKIASCWNGPTNTIPYWLSKPLRLALNKAMYVPSDQEIENAAKYLFSNSQSVRLRDLCAFLNMRTNNSKRVAQVWHQYQ